MNVATTSACPWRLDRYHARLQSDRLCATIDLQRPEAGLGSLSLDGQPVGGQILGVELPSSALQALPVGSSEDTGFQVDAYVRGHDLVTTYSANTSWPFRTQLYWRVLPAGAVSRIAAIELIVSVQTQLLDSQPRLRSISQLCGESIERLLDAQAARMGPATGAMSPRDGTSCVRLRAEGGAVAYAEMVHPLDFTESTLESRHTPSGALMKSWWLRHQLLSEKLEKGVILRARVLGVFLNLPDDAIDVAGNYDEFARSEPPLTV